MRTRPCAIDDCPRLAGVPGSARGWCPLHYSRWQRHGHPLVERARGRATCSIDECAKLVVSHGYCATHWSRVLRRGNATPRLRGGVVNGHRVCPRCSVDKPLADWGRHKGTSTGISSYCKNCMAAIQKANKARAEYVRGPRDPSKERESIRRWRRRNPDAVRSQCARRRAWRQQATTERFSVVDVFERDRWVCHICSDPIDRVLRYPEAMSASLDHVIPLARGGAHSPENCAASHLVCNIRKRDRLVTH